MRLRNFIFGIAGALVCLVPGSWAQGNSPVERIFYNAKIFTAEQEHPYAEAVAIRGDKIVAVGSRREVASTVGAGAETIDLHGKTMLPGLIDSHIHAIDGGVSLNSADVSDKVLSVAELAGFAGEAKKSGKGMRGDILLISGIPLIIWSKTDELNAQFNTGAYEKQPVFLQGSDGHTGWANRALRMRAGVTKDFISHLSESERKYYGLAADLEPNGFAVDAGLEKVQATLPKHSRQELLAAGRSAVHYLNSLGITAWLDPLADEPILTAYRDLSERGELTAHVAAFPEVKLQTAADPLIEAQALLKKFKDVPNLTVPGVKIFADGVVEYPSQSAAMAAPYKNTGKYGDLLFDPARFAKMVISADKQGLIVHIHAIGDKAVTESLNGIEAARKANGNSGLPHTITHLQFVIPSDVPRFKQLGVVAAYQLLWASANPEAIELVKPYIDPAVFVWQYPARSMLNAGATISGASDWYVSSPNVFLAIYQAETRKGPEGVLNADECMPREAMLYAYTRNSAHAMNQLDKIGSIAPGKQADFAVVDRDVLTIPAEELRGTKILSTILGGKTIFESKP
jgi:predicted amidohydrolase YtcJ